LGKVEEQHHLFESELRPALAGSGILLLNYPDLDAEQRSFVKNYFEDHIFPVLTPLSVDPAHPFPQMSNISLNLAVFVEDPETGIERFARVKVSDNLPCFVTLSDDRNDKEGILPTWVGLPLEQVIAQHLDRLFPGMLIKAHCLFRITRNADFPVKEDEADDLLAAITVGELRMPRQGKDVAFLNNPSGMVGYPQFRRVVLHLSTIQDSNDLYIEPLIYRIDVHGHCRQRL
jgi:polyphosphate kinase